MVHKSTQPMAPWRRRLHEIIFEADTPAGKAFDIFLIGAILLSVLVIMLDSVEPVRAQHHKGLLAAEWFFTILFSVEYLLRLICIRRPMLYAASFFGMVDLMAVLPTYLSLLFPGTQSMMVVRALRLLRVFRVFKLARMLREATSLWQAIKLSMSKIAVFLVTVLILVVIMGAVMHLIEGPQNPEFNSIPQGVYWAIVTLTTLGYGDVVPHTALGKALTAMMVFIGYSLIIIPTGVLSAELAQGRLKKISTQACPNCSQEGHDRDARHCMHCGASL